jgi:hypothetical protein
MGGTHRNTEYLKANIKKIRLCWKLTLYEFGDILGVSLQRIGSYENRGSYPDQGTMNRLIKLSGFSEKELTEMVIAEKSIKHLKRPLQLKERDFCKEKFLKDAIIVMSKLFDKHFPR